MYRTTFIALVVCLSLFAAAAAQDDSAAALEQALQDVCADTELWPGFDPLTVPLAVFDGSSTFLFRHPAPPEEFTRDGDVWVCEGRHPSVTANSSTRIGEVSTATVMLESLAPDSPLEVRAALVAHEGFHVFQGTTDRRWGANEANLFTYPVDDAGLLTLRRLETEALRRAFEATDDEATRAWVRHALEWRGKRFASLDPASRAYEQGMETMEGTANYVQCLVEGRGRPSLPESGFDAEIVRARAYETGTAWALLLDRFSPDWHAAFASDDSLTLDSALEEALDAAGRPDGSGAFTAFEIQAMEETAQSDAAAVLERRVERRVEFESAPGWRIIVEADAESPLWPQGFDPLNVHLVEGGTIHSRFVKLGNDNGSLEVMGMASLTEEVGPHPIFNGVRRLVVPGFDSQPPVVVEGDRVTISSDRFSADFTSASAGRSDRDVVIRLVSPEASEDGK